MAEADATAAIAALKDAGLIRTKKADWRLVAAAQAMLHGAHSDEFAAAEAMGKPIKQRSKVSNWLDKLRELERMRAAPRSQPGSGGSAAGSSLLVQPGWVDEHAPGVQQLSVSALVVSPGKQHATRSISAVVTTPLGTKRPASATVDYTLPPDGEPASAAKRRDDRHRKREERKIRSMDLSAAAQAHAEAEAGRQRALRESGREDRVQQREVSFVLDRIIRRLERQVQAEERVQRRELFVWSCPAGCGPQAADCGRLIFRRQCMPTADSIRRKQLFILRSDLLDGDSGLLGLGDFRSIGGHSFLKKKQWELFCQQEQAASEFLPGVDDILSDSEVAEIQSDFLSLWDGKVQSRCGPQIHFSNWLSRYLENGEVVTGNYEYRGRTIEIVYPDQFGDHLPVGAPACARRGCSGCCYCKGVPLPVMLEVDIWFRPGVGWHTGYGRTDEPPRYSIRRWMSLGELKRQLDKVVSSQPEPPRCREPVPAYLLNRREDVREPPKQRGVVCLPGRLRRLLSPSEVAASLAAVGVHLVLLEGDSRALEPTPEESALLEAHRAMCTEEGSVEEARAEKRLAENDERRGWEIQSEFEARRGCGQRLRRPLDPRARPRRGDLVYLSPTSTQSEPTVAAVLAVHNTSDLIPHHVTGMDLMVWDPDRLTFKPREHREHPGCLTLFPPCCGNGANCMHLRFSFPDWQWPDGRPLDVNRVLKPIPAALVAKMREMYGRARAGKILSDFRGIVGEAADKSGD